MPAKILLADDSNVAQRMGKEILSAEGYEIVTVSNGHAALKKLSEFVPDIMLLDIFMPVNSGYEVCEFVKSQPNMRHVPVVLLVGAMEPYDPEEGRRVQADGLITKPLQSSTLVSMVKDLLASRPEPAKEEVADKKPKREAASAPVGATTTADTAAPLEPEVSRASAPEPEIAIPEDMADQPLIGIEALVESMSEPQPVIATAQEPPAVSVPSASQDTSAEFPTSPMVDTAAETNSADWMHSDSGIPFAIEPQTAESPQTESMGRVGSGTLQESPSAATASDPGSRFENATTLEQIVDSMGLAAGDRGMSDDKQEPSTLAFLSNLLGRNEEEHASAQVKAEPESLQPPTEESDAARDVVWKVETAQVTADDEELFEKPVSDWRALSDILENDGAAGASEDAASAVAVSAPPVETDTSRFAELESLVAMANEPAAQHEHGTTSQAAAVLDVSEPESQPTPVYTEAAEVSFSEADVPLVGTDAPMAETLIDTPAENATVSGGPVDEAYEIVADESGNLADVAIADGVTESEQPAPLHLKQLDTDRIEQLIRESLEQMMPQIVDRIVRTVGVILRREQE